MKKTIIKAFGAIMATALAVVSVHAAGTNTWQGNQADANWGTALNWDTAAVPANGDSLVFGAQGSSGLTLNNNISGLSVNNFDINGPDSFTFSGNGLKLNGTLTDAAGVDETFSLGGITIGSAVGAAILNTSGGTLALGALSQTSGSGGTVRFTTTGAISTSTLDNNGLIGGWAAIDNGNSTYSWAHSGASGVSNITAATTSALGTSFSGNHSTVNWLNSDGATTLTAATTVNSFISANDVTISGLLTIGSGGVILGNNGSKWIKNGTGGQIASGLASGELFIYTPNTGSWDMELQVPIVNNGSTPGILVKDGSGLLHLIPNATYSGGTVINNGALFVQGSGGHITGSELGTGTVTISGGTLDFSDSGSANVINYAQSFVLNGGTISSEDGMPHLATGAGATITVNGPTTLQRLWGHVTQKYLALDGILQGSGTLTLQNESTPYDGSSIWINNAGNTFSGTVTVNANTYNGSAMVMGANSALQYATVNLQGTPNGNDTTTGTAKVLYGVNFKSGVTAPVLGALTGTGNFWLQDLSSNSVALTVGGNNSSQTFSGVLSGSGSLIKSGPGTLTLSGANTYTGNTTISGGTLALNGGSIGITTNITVASGATFDVSANGSLTLSGSQNLYGSGTNIGSIYTSSGSRIYAGTDGGYGTNCFNNDLYLASGALAYFDVGTRATGSNDLITVAGTLYANNNLIHLKAPGVSVSLQATDYTLFTSPNAISGSFASTPVWDTAPVNAANFTIVTSGNTVILHYTASTGPTGTSVAVPSSVTHNQTVLLRVTAVNGNAGTVNSVVVDASLIGGSPSLDLVAAGGNVWTNSVTVTPDTALGGKSLPVTLTDTASLGGFSSIALTVVPANSVWNGQAADDNWSSNLNWTNQTAPGYVGDNVTFAGTTRLTPNMDNNYSLGGMTFDTNAGSFVITSATASSLTLNGGVTNNSTHAQVLNVPIADNGGGLTKSGNGTIILAATNTYTGNTTINAGILNIGDAGQLDASGTYAGAIVDNGTFAYSSSATQTLSGVISGTGTLTQSAGLLTLTAANTFSGAVVVNGGTLYANKGNDYNNGVFSYVSGITVNNGGTLCSAENSLFGYGGTQEKPITVNAGGTLTLDSGLSCNVGTVTLAGGTLANLGASPAWGSWVFSHATDKLLVTDDSTVSALNVFMKNGATIEVSSGKTLSFTGTLTDATGDGVGCSLVKTGVGTLTLSGTNTYTGPTVINAGTLAGTGTIAGALTNNANLAPGNGGSGTLTVNGNITLNAGSTNTFAVNGTTLAISSVTTGAGVTYGGVLNIVTNGTFTAGQQFVLFSGTGATNASNFASIAGSPGSGLLFSFTNGVVSVVAGPSGPGTITNSISGNSLHLAWPAGQGWRLEAQTNSLSTGLRTTGWGTVSGTADGSYSVTIDPAKPTVFYRLVYP